MKFVYLLTTLLLLSFTPYKSQSDSFQSGERLELTVFYNVIGLYVNAGNASFTVNRAKFNTQDVYHIVGEGRTNPRYDWIFKVRDRYETFIHPQTYQPLKFIREVNEGDYQKKEEVVFDHFNRKAISNTGTISVPEKVQDVISCLYYARNLNFDELKKGATIPFPLFIDDAVFNMYIRFLGKETIRTKYGKFKAIKLKPLTLKGNVFEGGENMTVWVSDDNNHLPLRIESALSVGKIKVDLMKYENLKYPLTSFIGF